LLVTIRGLVGSFNWITGFDTVCRSPRHARHVSG
jgi:hypothetical protein